MQQEYRRQSRSAVPGTYGQRRFGEEERFDQDDFETEPGQGFRRGYADQPESFETSGREYDRDYNRGFNRGYSGETSSSGSEHRFRGGQSGQTWGEDTRQGYGYGNAQRDRGGMQFPGQSPYGRPGYGGQSYGARGDSYNAYAEPSAPSRYGYGQSQRHDGDSRRSDGYSSGAGRGRYASGYPDYLEEEAETGASWSRDQMRGNESGYSQRSRGSNWGGGQQWGGQGGGAGARTRGQPPRGYQRSDDRINEDICERVTEEGIDCSDIEVSVKGGVVTLSGEIADRSDKHRVEQIAADVSGVSDVTNNIRVKRRGDDASGSQSGKSSSGSQSAGNSNAASGSTNKFGEAALAGAGSKKS